MKIFWFLVFITKSFYIFAGEVKKTDVDQIQIYLQANVSSWSDQKKIRFHKSLTRVLDNWARKTKYRKKGLIENFSFQLNPSGIDFFQEIMISKAFAGQDGYLYCHFGGWMSLLDSKDNCFSPWSRALRRKSNGELDSFGARYGKKFSCGGKNLFRCNPLIFGSPKEPQVNPNNVKVKIKRPENGYCVKTNDSDPRLATQACLQNLNDEKILTIWKSFKDHPQKLAQFIGVAAETIRFCNDYGGSENYSYCQELVSFLEHQAREAISCVNKTDLYRYLPDIVSPLNQQDIDRIADGLGSEYDLYRKDLKKRQKQARKTRLAVYNKALSAYSRHKKTSVMINNLRKNATKCIWDSCAGRRGIKRNGPKSAKRSVAYCARYVKSAMLGSDCYVRDYPKNRYAIDSGNFLKKSGFVDITKIPELASITAENAPVGSIIVYEKVGRRRGRPGHIEVKTDDGEYISDFVNSEPTRLGGSRKPIAIYVKFPVGTLSNLVEVPEV